MFQNVLSPLVNALSIWGEPTGKGCRHEMWAAQISLRESYRWPCPMLVVQSGIDMERMLEDLRGNAFSSAVDFGLRNFIHCFTPTAVWSRKRFYSGLNFEWNSEWSRHKWASGFETVKVFKYISRWLWELFHAKIKSYRDILEKPIEI